MKIKITILPIGDAEVALFKFRKINILMTLNLFTLSEMLVQ